MKRPGKKTAAAGIIILIMYGTTVTVSETTVVCGSCHSPQKRTWAQGTHQSAECVDCHIEPGLRGALKAQVMGVHDLYVSIFRGNELTPHENPLPISTTNCLACHGAILHFNEMGWLDLPENSLKGQGLVIDHRRHIEREKMECVDCHRGIVHRDPADVGKYDRNWPFMHNDCGVCHNGEFSERFQKLLTDVEDESKKSCISCHPYFTPPPVHEK